MYVEGKRWSVVINVSRMQTMARTASQIQFTGQISDRNVQTMIQFTSYNQISDRNVQTIA